MKKLLISLGTIILFIIPLFVLADEKTAPIEPGDSVICGPCINERYLLNNDKYDWCWYYDRHHRWAHPWYLDEGIGFNYNRRHRMGNYGWCIIDPYIAPDK